jgi:hypothetical protein
MLVPLMGRLLTTVTSMVSPQLASMSGPGYCPLNTCITRGVPSGDMVFSVMSSATCKRKRGSGTRLWRQAMDPSLTHLDCIAGIWEFEVSVRRYTESIAPTASCRSRIGTGRIAFLKIRNCGSERRAHSHKAESQETGGKHDDLLLLDTIDR